jgi:phage terminase large subunit-like protein
LNEWIARGEKHHFVVKRLKNAERILTPKVLDAMQKEGKKLQGKNTISTLAGTTSVSIAQNSFGKSTSVVPISKLGSFKD